MPCRCGCTLLRFGPWMNGVNVRGNLFPYVDKCKTVNFRRKVLCSNPSYSTARVTCKITCSSTGPCQKRIRFRRFALRSLFNEDRKEKSRITQRVKYARGETPLETFALLCSPWRSFLWWTAKRWNLIPFWHGRILEQVILLVTLVVEAFVINSHSIWKFMVTPEDPEFEIFPRIEYFSKIATGKVFRRVLSLA